MKLYPLNPSVTNDSIQIKNAFKHQVKNGFNPGVTIDSIQVENGINPGVTINKL